MSDPGGSENGTFSYFSPLHRHGSTEILRHTRNNMQSIFQCIMRGRTFPLCEYGTKINKIADCFKNGYTF